MKKEWIKKMYFNVGAVVTGLVLVGAVGTAAWCVSNSDNAVKKSDGSSTVNAEKDCIAESSQMPTTTAAQVYSLMNYRKAHLNEYDMAEVTQVSKDTKTAKKSHGKKLNKTKFPNSNLEYYDGMNEPLNFHETRSIASEYYTVHDIISGSDVTLNAHELICRMVYSEIRDGWGEEAIKAQAVAAYSHIRFNDAINNIPTVGLKAGYTSKIENCVKAVEGQAVIYNNSIANTVYSASTAGYTVASENVWGVAYPYLKCVRSAYDDQDPNWGLEVKYSKDRVKEMLESKLGYTISDKPEKWFKITKSYSGKYISRVSIDGHNKTSAGEDITGIMLCNIFDVKSNAMDISYENGTFTFISYGWGHGVGMSQWGACLYAQHGYTYDQILTHYYVGTNLGLSNVNENAVNRGKAYNTSTQTADSTSSAQSHGTTSASSDTSGEYQTTTVPDSENNF